MSPPSGDAPRTPDRRPSTAALFGAFRSLTSGRLRSPTPPPSVSSASHTPARTPSLGSHRPDSVSSAPAAAAAADGALRRIEEVAPKATRPVLGGPPELEGLIAQLNNANSHPDRAAAVQEICKILEEYPVKNVLGLWSVASDMLLPEKPDEVAATGYQLLKSCVTLPELSPIERNVFFDAASLRKHDGSFHLRLEIISLLTHGGRNIEACESSIAPFILSSLDSCFKARRDALNTRKGSGKKSVDTPNREADNMANIFQYTIDICKFNSKVFSEDDVDLLLKKATSICQETTQTSDIENCIRLFDTVITYVHVPRQALRPCLEVLCAIHRQLVDLQEQTWNTLSNLFKSHVGQAAVACLLHTLLDEPDGSARKSRQFSLYRGTIQVLQLLLLEDGRNGLPKVPMSLLFPALRASIKEGHKTQEEFIINLIDAILAEDRMRSLLLREADWSDLMHIIQTCAERSDERGLHNTPIPDLGEFVPTERTMSVNSNGPFSAADDVTSVPSIAGELEADVISNPESTSHPSRHENIHRSADDSIFRVLIKLDAITADMDFVQKASTMELFMSLAHRLGDSTAENMMRFYAEERYLHPANSGWLEACHSLVDGVLKDRTRPRSLRLMSISLLRETYNTVERLFADDSEECGHLLLDVIEAETDVEVLHELVDYAVDAIDRSSNFQDKLEVLKRRLEQCRMPSSIAAPPSWNSPSSLGSACNVMASAFVRLFTRSVIKSARKTRVLYEILRYIAGTENFETDARLTALKLLFRLRADSSHALIVSSSSEGESIATVLCRTEDTAISTDRLEEVSVPDSRASGTSPHSSLSRHTSRHNHHTNRITKPVPPLWMYPGPKGLPEEPSTDASRVVFSHIDADEYPLSEDVLDMEITLWLELVISLVQQCPDWEIYSYIIVHLGPQLSNQSLVRSCVAQLRMMRNVVCERVRNSSFRDPPSYTLLKKADVAVCLYHILTVLISYHDYFEKSEEDELVKAFLHGISYWDRTSKWCIHALSVCCHELPLSVSKSLDNIVQKMTQIITKPATAIHILDFLTSLARMPELYKNFREEEFKMVFGVSFRYLQHIRDQRDRAALSSQIGHRSLRHSGPSRDFTSSPDASAKRQKSSVDDLPHYLYSLAYHVITFWFMGLKMEDRPKQIPWITKNLIYTDPSGKEVIEEQGQVILDIMNMVAYSDRDETLRDPNFSKPGDGEVWKKTWIVGHSLLTIETAARTGVSLITTRRPCGTRYAVHRPLLADPPSHQVPLTVGLASEAFYSSSYVGILPDDILQTYYAPLNLADPPIPLPDDDMTRRAIASFDRISTVDSYKVGVIYIGEGQKDEREILMNDIGSAAYTSFLSDLGTLMRLKGAKFNTGGLDTRDDMDGEFTYAWRDRCIELVFHITTMMPTNPDDDMTYPNKKRHIGNDFVNIIFNDSGLPYDFDTFPSAFNYVHIVIAPESRASFVDRRLDTDPDGKDRYYKVQVISKPGFPDISPAAETKILCGKHLAAYCRLMAINASVFSQVWFIREGGESISSWRNRLREIKRLRERYGANDGAAHAAATSPSSPVAHAGLGLGLASPPASRDANGAAPFKRTSVATFLSEGTNRSSFTTNSSHDTAG